MGYYDPATLKIGGKVPKRALLDALKLEGLGPKDLSRALKGLGDEDEKLYLDENGLLVVHDEEANYARFMYLEEALHKAGIAFDRRSDATGAGEFGPMWGQFRPGMGFFDLPADDGSEYGEWTVPVRDVRAHLAAGDLREWLDKTYPEIPDLEPFELIDDTVDHGHAD